MPVRPSICPIDRQQQWQPAGLLLSALDRQLRARMLCYAMLCTIQQTPVLSSKYWQCYVDSQRKRLNRDLLPARCCEHGITAIAQCLCVCVTLVGIQSQRMNGITTDRADFRHRVLLRSSIYRTLFCYRPKHLVSYRIVSHKEICIPEP